MGFDSKGSLSSHEITLVFTYFYTSILCLYLIHVYVYAYTFDLYACIYLRQQRKAMVR